MDCKVLFTATEDELLVELVAKHASLYDLANSLYKDQIVKDNAWKEIADKLGKSVEICKKRWRNIKDTYNRRKKKGKGTGSAAISKSAKWALADMLSFLDKVEHKRSSTSIGIDGTEEASQNEDVDIENSADSADVSEESSHPKPFAPATKEFNKSISGGESTSSTVKRQISKSNRIGKREKLNADITAVIKERIDERSEILKNIGLHKPDSVDLFFQSIAASVKCLRPKLINEAKMRTMQMIFDLEERNANEPPLYPPPPGPSSSISSVSTYTNSYTLPSRTDDILLLDNS